MYVITILVYPSVNKCNASVQTSLVVILLQYNLAFDTTDENVGAFMCPMHRALFVSIRVLGWPKIRSWPWMNLLVKPTDLQGVEIVRTSNCSAGRAITDRHTDRSENPAFQMCSGTGHNCLWLCIPIHCALAQVSSIKTSQIYFILLVKYNQYKNN